MKMVNGRPAMAVLRGVLSLLLLVIPIVLRSAAACSGGVSSPACATVWRTEHAVPQSTLFWWNVHIEGAPREATSDSSRAVMLGTPEQLTLRWVFQNAGEHHALTLVPDELRNGIRVAVTREDTLLATSVRWESVGKLHFAGGEIALGPSGAVVLNAGEHVEWQCTVFLDRSGAWIPGRYELHFELSRGWPP